MAGAIRSLVYAMDLKLECARVLHETLFVLIVMYGSIDGQPQRFAGY